MSANNFPPELPARTTDRDGKRLRPVKGKRPGMHERIGAIRPGDDVEVAREIQRLWLEVHKQRRWTNMHEGGADGPEGGGLGRWVEGGVPDAYLDLTGLRGYWRMGENSGTTFADSSGSGHPLLMTVGTETAHITYNANGPASLGEGDDGCVKMNKAGSADPTSDNHGDADRFDVSGSTYDDAFTGDFTLLGWFKYDDLGAAGLAGMMSFNHQPGGEDRVAAGLVFDHATNLVRAQKWGVYDFAAGIPLEEDEWYLIALVHTSTEARLYFNGVLVGSDTYASSPGQDGTGFEVGHATFDMGFTDYEGWWTGWMDELAGCTAALTQQQILSIFHANGAAGSGGHWVGNTTVHGSEVTEGSIDEDRLSFDVATQDELDAVEGDAVMDGDAAGGVLGGTFPDPSFAVDMATQAELDAHVNDASDAHDASAISILDTAGDFTATEVEGALAELQSDAEADAQALADHLADTSDAHDASAISILDTAGDFTATEVEGALAELQADAEAHLADTSDAHDASAISFSPTGTVAATDVQAAIAEVASEASSDLAGKELGYTEKTSDTSITATTPATSQVIVTAPAIVYDGAPVMIEFWSGYVNMSAIPNSIIFVLWDDTAGAGLGLIGLVRLTEAGAAWVPVNLRRRFTPAAGSRTYSMRAYVTGGTGGIGGGAGGAGVALPCFVRVTKV